MDRVQAMQVFLRVVESGSFIRAAGTLGLPASSVTGIIKRLEKHLRARLLNRSTRNLSLTPEGERYFHRCREILDLIDDTESSLHGSAEHPQGRVRVDMPGGIAHAVILSQLAQFQARYPDIYLMISINDRQVDLIQDGVDCVIRTGSLHDSTLVARRLGELRWITCATPSYLNQQGIPESLEDLQCHRAVHYFSSTTRRTGELHFVEAGDRVAVPVAGTVAVNETGLYIKLGLAGGGLMQLAEILVADHLRSGDLVEVLANMRPEPVPVSLIYPHHRFLSPAMQAFVDWTTELFSNVS
ncbi:transcriptional regulator [Duganella sp. Leaf61]|uniref:HTH-type transcriptional regulator PgrR n=1 Tax=Duganella phyllosphaerae TaxID=762836 RepID=A0A1E7X7B1_9BURK|nr:MULTISPECIES: LysR family transcriptional regulator [Duganella]KQN76378.1 transcriptional regulator [Duganella sp. Leaf61]OFA09017.1 HTH-type transcriptional regulator PgrR [Duganella phyllosphaerae]